jgi:MYXO-CTERM domain-containing protein
MEGTVADKLCAQKCSNWSKFHAFCLVAALGGCQLGDEPLGETAKPLLTLDPGLNFFSFKCNNTPAFDPAGDQPNATDHRDVVGNPTEAEAAIYFASDADRLYLRMRLDGDPRSNPTNLRSFGWGFLFDTESRGDPSLPEYERLAHVNGTGGKDRISLFDNTEPVENSATEPAEVEVVVYGDVIDRWVVNQACSAGASTCFSDNDDFFLTWAVDWSDLEAGLPDFQTAPVDRSSPMVLWAGTTNNNAAINTDFACFDNGAGVPDLDEIPVNPPVVLSCGNNLLEGSEGCDDGNQTNGDGCDANCLIEDGFPCGPNGDPSCASGECDDILDTCGSQCDNGVLENTEGCDDGNQTPGDGCGATCLIETGEPCNGGPDGQLGDASCESGLCDETEGGTGICEEPDTCGNGVQETGEDCDDGNTDDGDGCSALCVTELVCGNGVLQENEGCDDGNTDDGDGCNADCLIENDTICNTDAAGIVGDASCASNICDLSGGGDGVCEPPGCGNGRLEANEGCDDGDTDAGDGCSTTCLIEDGQDCNDDPEGRIGDDSCTSGICDTSGGEPGVCEPAGCGNGLLESGEGCDDGNASGGDGCSATCLIEDGGACNTDVAGETGDDSCASDICDLSEGGAGVCEGADTCGNNRLESGEGCDDGNNVGGDGCSSSCLIEDNNACNDDAAGTTGDGSCASGICDNSGGAPGVCEPAGCGNNLLESGEGCDDGNTANGDGCSTTCLIENNNACNDDSAGATGDASCFSGICDTSGGAPGVCEPAGCGNGLLETGEGCDDGNATSGDGCSATCLIEDDNACNDNAAGATGDASCASGICDVSEGGAGVCEPAGCGNNVLESGEGCDDGNTTSGDGCSATCLIEDGGACNDNAAGETGDGSCESGICDTTGGAPGVCEPAGCGNNVLEAGEGCDDGGTAPGDGCDDNCLIEDGEVCNDDTAGNTGDTSCASGICDESEGGAGICEPSGCGNGVLEAAEGCDDGNIEPGDGCAANCFVEDGEACNDDPAGQTGDASCESGICDASEGGSGICEPAGCGNNLLEAGEGCDDGNTAAADGCNDGCLIEDGEACNDDPAGSTGDDSCASGICDASEGGAGICEPSGCGNNLVEEGEGCDDGNTDDFDGCSGRCLIEDGMPCELDPDGDFDSSSCESDSCDSSGTCNEPFGVSGGGCGCSSGGDAAGTALPIALALGWLLLISARRRRRRLPVAVALVAVALSQAPRVQAQEAIEQGFALERFRLAGHDEGFLNVEWAGVLEHLDWDAAFWLGISDDPLVVFRDEDGERERVGSLVSHRVSGTLMGSIGLYDRFQVTLELPLIMSQDDEEIDGVMSGLSGAGLGDIRVAPKVLIASPGGFHIAAVAGLTFPTGGGDGFRGDSNVSFVPEALVSKALGPWRMSANLGYRARENVALPELAVGDELFANLGASYRFADAGGPPLETGLTLAAATRARDPFDRFNHNQLEVLGGANYRVTDNLVGVLAAGLGIQEGYGTPDWRMVLAVRWRQRAPEEVEEPLVQAPPPDPDRDNDGFLNEVDACPDDAETVNGIEDDDGCPDADTDGDKIADSVDKCPKEAEDFDSFEDADGCPDLDNDQDTVVDAADKCINEPGPVENEGCPDSDRDGDTVVDRLDNCPDEPGPPENQGCKKKQLVQINQNKIELLEVVYFETARSRISKRSYPLLDNVGSVLDAHAQIKKVRIEGHTDSRGGDKYNKNLSARRARAVRVYLIGKGIAPDRLVAEGFGEEKPIADNTTEEGRSKNRRVEFVIVEGGEAPAGAPAAPAVPAQPTEAPETPADP